MTALNQHDAAIDLDDHVHRRTWAVAALGQDAPNKKGDGLMPSPLLQVPSTDYLRRCFENMRSAFSAAASARCAAASTRLAADSARRAASSARVAACSARFTSSLWLQPA